VTPVPGWTAEETSLYISDHTARSYIVRDCPLFELDKAGELREPAGGAFGTMSDFTLLCLLREGLSATEIAEIYEIKPQSVIRQQKKLKREGFLRRTN
jgi:DNA-binding MarR family transcriptional regulator